MICVLQFDSVSVSVMERMLAEGKLPRLAELRETGRVHELETPAADFAAGAFYTLYSGLELGDHGLFYPFQFSAAEQRARYVTAFDAPPPVWEVLARAGKRTLAVDPYESRPPARWSEEHGTLVCGVGFRDRVVMPRWARPAVAGKAAGKGPQATEIFGTPRVRDLLALREKLATAPARVADAAIAHLGRESYDLAWLTFSAAHLAGHQFWDLSQIAEEPSAEDKRLLQTALEEIYVAVDTAIGRVVDALPEGTDVIVVSAVGMEVNTSRADLLPGMLAAVLRGEPLPEQGSAGWIWRLRAAIPPGARGAIAQALPDRLALELTARLELRGVDWASTRAFTHPADNQGYIRLNLRGREREGVVDPGEAGALMDEIEAGLRSFSDIGGGPAVASVERVGELYPGARGERLPDLSVRWSGAAATRLEGVVSERYGEVRREGSGSGRSGNHTPDGAWAVVVPGASRAVDPARAPRLPDVAATVASVCGISEPSLAGESLLSV